MGPLPFALVWVVPAKKAVLKRYPMAVMAKARCTDGSPDPLCPYAALVDRWLACFHRPVTHEQRVRAMQQDRLVLGGRETVADE